jgi:type II secretory pathway component PulF
MSGVWPTALVNALKAGEESGKVTDVLSQISESLNLQKTINEALSGLVYPAGVIVAALLNFLGLMVFAVPKTARTIHAENTNAITQLAVSMESFFNAYWPFLLMGLVLALLKLYTWVSSPEGRRHF